MDGILRRRGIIASAKPKDQSLIFEAKNVTLTGANYIDTGFMPFSEANINRDFEITFLIDNVVVTERNYTIVGCMYEGTVGGVQYPGFVARGLSNSGTTPTGVEVAGYQYNRWGTEPIGHEFKIKRINGVFTTEAYTGATGTVAVHSTVFNQKLLVGAAQRPDGTLFRYGKFDLRYITVKYL